MHPELYRRQAIDIRRKKAKRVLTHEQIDGHVDEFLANGGHIQKFRPGETGETDMLAKAIRTLSNRRKKQIRPKKYAKPSGPVAY